MSATCGRTSLTPYAFFDPDYSSLRMSQATFPWASTLSSVTLPAWGMWDGTALYELPMLVPATVEPDCSSLLPTPRTSDANGAGTHGEGGDDLRTAVSLLPTPRATRGGSATETVALLLPTPKATNNENRQSLDRYGPNLGMALNTIGVPTELPSNGTPPPSDDDPPHLWTPEDD